MDGLPPFSPDATCPKCGGDCITIAWCPADATSDVSRRDCANYGEHMQRECTSCGYAWAEAPLDAEEGA